jgi:MFS family permease
MTTVVVTTCAQHDKVHPPLVHNPFVAAAAVTVLLQGVIADVFEPSIRGTAAGLFMIPLLVGPLLGPLLGGVLSQVGPAGLKD